MAEISYRRHRFPPVIIQHAVWLYLRFTLSSRDVEEILAEQRYRALNEMRDDMHQRDCAERVGMPIKFIHVAQILNGASA